MTFGDRFCFSRKGPKGGIGGGGWVHHLEMPWLALGATAEKIVLSPCTAPISSGEAFIPVWASCCQLSAMTIASSLVGGCGLSQKYVEDGCKSTCVKFGGQKPGRTGDTVSLIHV